MILSGKGAKNIIHVVKVIIFYYSFLEIVYNNEFIILYYL